MPIITSNFSASLPFKNGHFNTIYRALFMKETHNYRRERITTWDNDFIDLDFIFFLTIILIMVKKTKKQSRLYFKKSLKKKQNQRTVSSSRTKKKNITHLN